ncbi:hypothetical protein Dda_2815 [Drechslerella dactyloides]|uniref:Uncharacterized protein n=1 Tax=Drechslerella dactyloides TaxID=74499 RepID=A0AAD6NM88_DREDA|nr:hypothetical protein Dda_2815 [Drechslerella dactyloides]
MSLRQEDECAGKFPFIPSSHYVTYLLLKKGKMKAESKDTKHPSTEHSTKEKKEAEKDRDISRWE